MKKKKRKTLFAVLCVLALSAVLSVPFSSLPGTGSAAAATVHAARGDGMRRQNGCCRYYMNGKMLKNCWREIGGKKYYFKKNGNAATLSCKVRGRYYVFNKKGQLMQPPSTKVVKIGKKKYQVNSKGMAVKGWSRNKKNYFYDTGEMVTGIEAFKEKFYCFKANGTYDKKKTAALRKAAKREQPFAPVKKIIGNPKKADYVAGCFKLNGMDGKDGILKYKNFTVYTFKTDRKSTRLNSSHE